MFEWDASLVRDGTYYAAMILAKRGGSDEDIALCIQALNVGSYVILLWRCSSTGTAVGACKSVGKVCRVRAISPLSLRGPMKLISVSDGNGPPRALHTRTLQVNCSSPDGILHPFLRPRRFLTLQRIRNTRRNLSNLSRKSSFIAHTRPRLIPKAPPPLDPCPLACTYKLSLDLSPRLRPNRTIRAPAHSLLIPILGHNHNLAEPLRTRLYPTRTRPTPHRASSLLPTTQRE